MKREKVKPKRKKKIELQHIFKYDKIFKVNGLNMGIAKVQNGNCGKNIEGKKMYEKVSNLMKNFQALFYVEIDTLQYHNVCNETSNAILALILKSTYSGT